MNPLPQVRPIFRIDPLPKLAALPEGPFERINVRYPLIPPYAYVHIYWDQPNKELVYTVEEPELTQDETYVLTLLEEGIKELINISFIAVKEGEQVITYLEKNVQALLEELRITINDDSYQKVMYYIYRDFVGLGKVEPLLNDYFIEDIECNGCNLPVYIVHRKYRNLRTNLAYKSNEELRDFVERLAQKAGKYISYANPLLDGSLADGSRVNATFTQDISSLGPTFTIRKFTKNPWTPIHLIHLKTASPQILAYLWLLIEYERNIMIVGATAAGKTTFLNGLAFFIPPQARVVTIEDTRELMLFHSNWLPSVARAGVGLANLVGQKHGEVTLFDLLKESFRQRPDYVIVGEIRGPEAYVLFQGMSSLRGDEEIFIIKNKMPTREKIKNLKNFEIEGLKTVSYNIDNKKAEILPIRAFVQHPPRNKLYKITTKLGREITVTPDHSLFSIDHEKIVDVKTDTLTIGSKIVIPSLLPCGYNNLTHINLLEYFPHIRVYSPEYIREASHRLGYAQAGAFCGCSSITDYYSNFKRSKPSAMNAEKFLELMKEANVVHDINHLTVRFDKKSKSFPALLEVSDPLLKLFGYYLSDGTVGNGISGNQICLYNKNKEILDDMRSSIYYLTGVLPDERITDRGFGSATELSFNHKVLLEILTKLCKRKEQKRIPDFIFGLDKRKIGIFLSALYAGDGSLTQKSFTYYTISKDLANDVTQLLLVYGIVAKIGKRNRIGRKTTDYEIVFYSSYKKEEFLKYVQPIGKTLELKRFTRPDLNLRGDLYLDEVKSIEVLNLDETEPVYDIAVPGNQNFIGGFGTLLLHNSGHPSLGTMHANSVETMIRRLSTPPINLSGSLVESLDAVCVMVNTKLGGNSVRRLSKIEEIENVNEKSMTAKTLTPYVWDPNTDNFIVKDKSLTLAKIQKEHGVLLSILERELELRTKLLIKLYQLGIFSPQQVHAIINEYYKDPAAVINRFRLV